MTSQQVRTLYEHVMTAQHALHEAIRLDNIEPTTPEQAERRERMCKRAESRLRGAVAMLDRLTYARHVG